jgi:hypothetical protein
MAKNVSKKFVFEYIDDTGWKKERKRKRKKERKKEREREREMKE